MSFYPFSKEQNFQRFSNLTKIIIFSMTVSFLVFLTKMILEYGMDYNPETCIDPSNFTNYHGI